VTPTRAKRLRAALNRELWIKRSGGFMTRVCEVRPEDLAELLEIAGIDAETHRKSLKEAREAARQERAHRYDDVVEF
jgi:hypothetical protein